MHRHTLLAAFSLALTVSASAAAQGVVIVLPGDKNSSSHGFSGFGSAPISNTAVLHSRMDRADSGATLGFAIVIRGTSGWYNARTQFSDLTSDSLAAGEVGQRWAVGRWQYQFVYNPQQKTLAVFDTTVSLDKSRIVFVTLPSAPDAKPTVTLGAPVPLTLSQPTAVAPRLLESAPEIRSFAGLP